MPEGLYTEEYGYIPGELGCMLKERGHMREQCQCGNMPEVTTTFAWQLSETSPRQQNTSLGTGKLDLLVIIV